jgi:hypothetical protein
MFVKSIHYLRNIPIQWNYYIYHLCRHVIKYYKITFIIFYYTNKSIIPYLDFADANDIDLDFADANDNDFDPERLLDEFLLELYPRLVFFDLRQNLLIVPDAYLQIVFCEHRLVPNPRHVDVLTLFLYSLMALTAGGILYI